MFNYCPYFCWGKTDITIFKSFRALYTIVMLVLTLKVESRRRRHRDRELENPITFGTLYDRFDGQFREGQKFMKHQISAKTKHRRKGWRHGQRSSESESSSSKERIRQSPSTEKEMPDHSSEYRTIFVEFLKSQVCENSPVYKKFLQYYDQASSRLRRERIERKTSWLQELANREHGDICFGNCSVSDDTNFKYGTTKEYVGTKPQRSVGGTADSPTSLRENSSQNSNPLKTTVSAGDQTFHSNNTFSRPSSSGWMTPENEGRGGLSGSTKPLSDTREPENSRMKPVNSYQNWQETFQHFLKTQRAILIIYSRTIKFCAINVSSL